MRARVCLLALAGAAGAGWSGVAVAAEAPAARPSGAAGDADDRRAKAQAQALLDEGADAYDRGDYASALERFRAAYDHFPSPKLWFNIGQANRDLGRPVAALEAFEQFLGDAPDAPADARAEAQSSAADLRATLGRLELTCATRGAEASVDGQAVGAVPVARQIWLTPGRHQIAVRSTGFVPVIDDVEVVAGEVRAVQIRLLPLVGAAPGATPAAGVTLAAAPDGDDGGATTARPPFYKSTWFWAVAVGAVAAGAAAAVWATRGPQIADPELGTQPLPDPKR